ncbi:Dot/Icm T4SS effector [Legionella wadsworthii]|uniref:Dot/Icm T4SS effector n=1 Tax=Legionella wadsworthii TaxID=28088 RepID=A0A378LT44_9GAMM|nr:hypothetical protein [Legionella wadsworthii]STY29980.1 Dot/Icm T4SS effector [Legionella wadsworthii]
MLSKIKRPNRIKIDNPGGGDCGFYALAVGLIDIIQKQHALTETSTIYQHWKVQSPGLVDLEEILGIDLNELYTSSGNYKKEHRELMFKLQMSLRSIACNIYQNEPIFRLSAEDVLQDERGKIDSTPIYCKFAEIVDFYLDRGKDSLAKISQFNELAFSPEVRRLAEETAKVIEARIKNKGAKEAQKIEKDYIKEVLVRDIILNKEANPDSIILKGVEKIEEQGRWATHYDLKEIADQLHVNLHVVGQMDGRDNPLYPTVTLYNEGNAHWTTSIQRLPKAKEEHFDLDVEADIPPLHHKELSPKEEQIIEATVSTQQEGDKVGAYRRNVRELMDAASTPGFFSKVKNKIENLENLDELQAEPGESDEKFALRLQEAHYRRALK